MYFMYDPEIDINEQIFGTIVLSPHQELMCSLSTHTGDFPRGVGHRVENGRGLTKVAVVLLNGLIW